MLCTHKKANTPEDISTIWNPASTGIWKPDGNVDFKRLNQLTGKSILHPELAKHIILQRHFDELLQEIHGSKNLGNATTIYMFFPVPWKKVTSGLIDELFRYNSDCTYQGENALTVERLTDFYTTGSLHTIHA